MKFLSLLCRKIVKAIIVIAFLDTVYVFQIIMVRGLPYLLERVWSNILNLLFPLYIFCVSHLVSEDFTAEGKSRYKLAGVDSEIVQMPVIRGQFGWQMVVKENKGLGCSETF